MKSIWLASLLLLVLKTAENADGGGDTEGNIISYEYLNFDELKSKLKSDERIRSFIQHQLEGISDLHSNPSVVITTQVHVEETACGIRTPELTTSATTASSLQAVFTAKPANTSKHETITVSNNISTADPCETAIIDCGDRFIKAECISAANKTHCANESEKDTTAFATMCELKRRCLTNITDFCVPCSSQQLMVQYSCHSKENIFTKLKNEGWYPAQNGMLYIFSREKVNYTVANKRCLARGGRLSSTGMRNSTVRSELIEKVLNNTEQKIWIGLRKNGSSWVWSDGVINETIWHANEPNNINGKEDCALFHQEHIRNGKLIDVNCDKIITSICEIALD